MAVSATTRVQERDVAAHPARRWRISRTELTALTLAAWLVVGAAFGISAAAASHVEQAATHQAMQAASAVVTGYVEPLISADLFGMPDPPTADLVNEQLERLTASGEILRIKIWSPDGTVLFSDLVALRGRQFPIDEELEEALAGEPATEISDGSAPENEYERDLAGRLFHVYLPISEGPGQKPVGAYEIYRDATPILNEIAATRRDAFTIAGAAGLVLLISLYAAFRGGNKVLADLASRLRRSESQFRSLVQNSSDLVIQADPAGVARYVSPASQRMLGVAPGSWVERPVSSLVHPDDAPWLDALVERLGGGAEATISGEVRLQHADGRWRWFEVVATNLAHDPELTGIVLNCRDVTERRALEDQLRHQAFHDPLTALANRPLLADRIQHELKARLGDQRSCLGVLLLDLDDFKTINDSLGHAAGDQLLVAVAERLSRILRSRDTAARVGGDEFVMLVRGRGPEEIQAVADRTLDALKSPFNVGQQHLRIGGSIGIAFADGPTTTADELLRCADAAMYMAKARGKAQTVTYEPSMHDAAVQRLRVKADLARDIEAGHLRPLYQPIVELTTGRPVGVEVLVRWDHPAGAIEPSEFIPLAEEMGLIGPLGRFVLNKACRTAEELGRTTGIPLQVNVNTSALQILDPGFPQDVADILAAAGLDPGRLTLELTESMLLAQADEAMAAMQRLRDLGIRLSLDDFGTGYSSLRYLRELPLDELKIDRSFTAALDAQPGAPEVLRSIIDLAASLGLTLVAEGIETAEQAARLRHLGVTRGQGFLFARPMDETELADHLVQPDRALAAG